MPAWESSFRLKIKNQAAHGDQLKVNEISNFRNSLIHPSLNGGLLEGKILAVRSPASTEGICSEQKAKYGAIIGTMARCRVSFTDSDNTEHAAVVEAESLYEAVALAVADFREDPLLPSHPSAMTEFIVAVLRNPTEHRIRLNQVSKWAEHTTKDGPAGITKRQRVRNLLGEKA